MTRSQLKANMSYNEMKLWFAFFLFENDGHKKEELESEVNADFARNRKRFTRGR